MANLKDWKADQTKFLVIGESGTGKTRFSGTFPKPFLFSFDGGIDTLGGLDIDYEVFIESDRTKPTAYRSFLTKFEQVGKDPTYQTIILDNITNLSKFIMDELIYVNNLVDKNLGQQSWDMYRILKGKMGDLITKSVTQQRYIVCTALPEWETDKNSGEMKVFPSTEGRFRQELCAWFGEVYYTHVEKTKDGLVYRLKTKADGKYTAKSRLDEVIRRSGGKGLPELLEPSYDVLMSYVNPSKK